MAALGPSLFVQNYFTGEHSRNTTMPKLPRIRSEGVEETKEGEPFSPKSTQQRSVDQPLQQPLAAEPEEPETREDECSFHRQVEEFTKTVLGSCGALFGWSILNANHPPPAPPQSHHGPIQLSIADELRKLAAKEGRVFGGGMRRADIPRFLGEEAVYSFDDDNISAISQHTLEEMTRHGVKYPVRRKASGGSSEPGPPDPSRSSSASTASDQPAHQELQI